MSVNAYDVEFEVVDASGAKALRRRTEYAHSVMDALAQAAANHSGLHPNENAVRAIHVGPRQCDIDAVTDVGTAKALGIALGRAIARGSQGLLDVIAGRAKRTGARKGGIGRK